MAVISLSSNIASLQALRRLGQSTAELNTSQVQLASGLRINRAADDASGLSIADGLRADVRVFHQAVRNLNDGMNLLNIADGALGELGNVLTRLGELATQSANGTLSSTQRAALNQEAQALRKEYNRIARTTSFNGVALLDGSFGSVSLQDGYGQNGSVAASMAGAVGTGAFDSARNLITLSGVTDAASADLNLDGYQDLVFSDSFSVSRALLGNGDGTFRAAFTFASGGSSNTFTVLSDYNSDGFVDVAAFVSNIGATHIFLGNGNGTFRAARTYAALGNGAAQYSAQTADVNGDGVFDLLFTAGSTGSAELLLGNADGSFSAARSLGDGIQRTVTGDFNGDGKLDFSVLNSVGTQLTYLGYGNGTFQTVTGSTQSFLYDAGDVNNDGLDDLLSGGMRILLSNGNGTYRLGTDSAFSGAHGYGEFVDINSDGILDVIDSIGSQDGAIDAVSVLFGNGNGTFLAPTSFLSGVNQSHFPGERGAQFDLADFDNDGVLDLATFGFYDNSTSLLRSQTTTGVANLNEFSLANRNGALSSIPLLTQTRERLALQRAKVGAIQSRITTALANRSSQALEYSSSESRIRDADIAQVSANLVRQRVIQQAGAAVLAQANQTPALALTLLG